MSSIDFWVALLLFSMAGIAILTALWTADKQEQILRRLKEKQDAVEDDDIEDE